MYGVLILVWLIAYVAMYKHYVTHDAKKGFLVESCIAFVVTSIFAYVDAMYLRRFLAMSPLEFWSVIMTKSALWTLIYMAARASYEKIPHYKKRRFLLEAAMAACVVTSIIIAVTYHKNQEPIDWIEMAIGAGLGIGLYIVVRVRFMLNKRS
jgi:hypothetical protein